MRKKLLAFMATCLFVSVVAFAQNASAAPPDKPLSVAKSFKGLKPLNMTFGCSGQVALTAVKNMPSKRKASGQEVSRYVEADYTYPDSVRSISAIVAYESSGENEGVLYNMWGYTDTLSIKTNITAGTVSVAATMIANDDTYGPIWICPIDLQSRTFSTSSSIQGTISADGTVTLGSWGVFVVSGKYEGSSFGVYSKSVFMPANATISDVLKSPKAESGADSIETFPACVRQVNDNEAELFNLGNVPSSVILRLSSDSTVTISPQYMLSNRYYGDFYCYPANFSEGSGKVEGNITGKGNPEGIDLGNWGIFARSGSSRYRIVKSSTVHFANGTLNYPAPLALDWMGQGTESLPYVITKPEQLLALSESVAKGEDYQKKFIALGANIDLSAVSRSFIPIGNKLHPFKGTFDGAGYTISNLNIHTGIENYQGLFGYADDGGVLKNIRLDSPNITTQGKYAGFICGETNGTVMGCVVTGAEAQFGNINSGGILGGLSDGESSQISSCSFSGAIHSSGEAGGIVGNMSGNTKATLLECHGSISMTASISSAYNSTGGLVGSFMASDEGEPVLTNSYSDAQVNNLTGIGAVGGVIGEMNAGSIRQCFNAGIVYNSSASSSSSSHNYIGGIAGSLYGGTLVDCYNGNYVASTGSASNVGGLVGCVLKPMVYTDENGDTVEIDNLSKVERCVNTGEVRASGINETCGIYGTTFNDSVFHSTYYDSQMAGGVVPDSISEMAKTTAELTNGQLPEGLSASIWKVEKGFYPCLQGMDTSSAATLCSLPLSLCSGDNVLKVKRNFKLAQHDGFTWKLYQGESLVDETEGLKISGDSVELLNAYYTGLVSVHADNDAALIKMHALSTVNPSAFKGLGTKESPYLISTSTDLCLLDSAVAVYNQSFSGDFFKQTSDIDCSGATTFKGIATGSSNAQAFDATYDGDGYAIHHLNIHGIVNDESGKAVRDSSSSIMGLFGIIGSHGLVKSLTLSADCSVDALHYAGGIAAVVLGKIENCKNYASVSTLSDYAGGIAGMCKESGWITQCYNAGKISTGDSYAAGIAGYLSGKVTYCQNDGEIAGDSINPALTRGRQNYVAGIAAFNLRHNEISGNVNTGYIHAFSNVGGISTNLSYEGSTFCNNINYGMVTCLNIKEPTRGALLSNVPNQDCTVSGNCYDAQIDPFGAAKSTVYKGLNGVNTSVLTASALDDNFSTDLYDFSQGLYPVIKAFKDEPAAKAHRSMVVTFADGQSADDVLSSAFLHTAEGLSWSVDSAKVFTVEGSQLVLHASEGKFSQRDKLTAKFGNYQKVIDLRHMPDVFTGKGTAADPYLIYTKDDMQKLAYYTNDEQYPFNGRYFKLMNDIDFGTTAYEPVAVDATQFNADFDGNGKSLSSVSYTASGSQEYRALFGNVGPNGSIHNLTLESGTISAYGEVGGIAGNLYGKVYNCINRASISAENSGVGGIAAVVKDGGAIYECKNQGVLGASSGTVGGIAATIEAGACIRSCTNDTLITTSEDCLGGIVAKSGGTVSHCVNLANLTASGKVGGIVGLSLGGDSIISCHNEGTLTVDGWGDGVAGIVAMADDNELAGEVVTDCYNVGNISGNDYAGGIVGSSTLNTKIRNCHNTANITGGSYTGGVAGYTNYGAMLDSCYNTGAIVATGYSDAGGVVGSQDGDIDNISVMTHCYNTGNISNSGSYTGGIAGDNGEGTYYYNCWNSGDITSEDNYVGGVSGGLSGEAYDCYNTGNISSIGYGLGGVGGIGAGSIVRCFNLGDVTGTESTDDYGVAGGLWGYGACRMLDSYNMGTLMAKQYAGGLIAGVFDGFSATNCYNAGKVVTEDSTTCGNICPNTENEMELINCAYDKDVNPNVLSTSDSPALALHTRELTLMQPDSAFLVKPGMYPTLKVQANNQLANWFAAVPVPAESEDYAHLKSDVIVGSPEGTQWSTSSTLYLFENKIGANAPGEGTCTKTFGEYSKSYALCFVAATGIGQNTFSEQSPAEISYYSVNGMYLGHSAPIAPGVYIVREKYADGHITSHQYTVKRK